MSAPVAADVHIALRDGSTAHVRPVSPADTPALRDFLAGLSENSRWLRFFSLGVNLDRAAEHAAKGDRPEGYGLIVTTGAEERVVAHAVFELERADRAEVAFAVADEMQGRGLATVLIAHLAQIASARGVTTFTATVLPENRRMISVFRESGFPVHVRASPDGIELEFPTELGEDARRKFEDRDRIAAVAAVERVLRPRSVAVIGASRRPDSFGGAAFRHALGNGFRGELYPVNPNADFVGSRRAAPSVADTPGPVDMAIVAVPAETVPAVARECADAGIAALVVITAGFAEAGAEGAARLAELLEVCRASGMRLVGPNSMGVVNTDPAVALTGTFGRADVPAGTVGFVSQSGAFGAAAIDGMSRRGIGLSAFVSLGDKADLSSNDVLQYWEQDPATQVVALYLESFGNPRKFGRVARRVARAKPVLAVKAGRTSAGARAASSHTGALIAASDSTVDALFASAGVIRCESLDDLLDAAAVLAEQPTPRGSGVGIVGNARGPCVICADACTDAGLSVASLSAETQAALRAALPPESVVAGPVQLVAAESPAGFRTAVERVAADPAVDAVIAIFVEHIATGADEAAAALAAAARDLHAAGIPLLAVFMTPGPLPRVLREGAPSVTPDRDAASSPGAPVPLPTVPREAAEGVTPDRDAASPPGAPSPSGAASPAGSSPGAVVSPARVKVPTFRAPEAAARALGRAAAYGRLRATSPAEPARLEGVDGDAAAAILAGSLARGGGWLRPDEVAALLGAYGIALVEQRRARSVAAVAKAAAELGGPVALKGIAPGVVHKTRAGAVRLDLHGPTAVRRAAQEIAQRLDAAGTPVEGFLVQRMAGAGVEMLVGVLADERFGPVVACGAGGGTAEVLEDVAVRLAPLAVEDAHDMIRGLRSRALLERARADVDALADIAVRVGALADAHPAIAELDLNPVMVGPDGAPVVDARVRVAPPAVQPVFPAVGR